jgi:L-lactate dehydrogenase complex protein LldG
MSSKESILDKIVKHKPDITKAQIDLEFESGIEIYNEFHAAVEKVGGKITSIQSIKNWGTWMRNAFGTGMHVYSEIDALEGNFTIDTEIRKNQWNKIDVAILEGEFGVAENGAIWVEKFAFRALPFITQHLVLVLRSSNIIANLHEAYAELAEFGMPDFGVFISGPSKTADIEQSLVYGAHGPKTLTVVLV